MGRLLSIERKSELEEMVPLEGIDYQVLNKDGNILFGSISKQYIKNQRDLLNSLNKNIYDKNNIVKFYPVFDEHRRANRCHWFSL